MKDLSHLFAAYPYHRRPTQHATAAAEVAIRAETSSRRTALGLRRRLVRPLLIAEGVAYLKRILKASYLKGMLKGHHAD